MRTRADVVAELQEVESKNPTSWSSSMARAAKVSQLKNELKQLDSGHFDAPSIQETTNLKKLKFEVEGVKITIEV